MIDEREAAAWAAKWLEDNALALIDGKSSRDEATAAVALRRAMQQLAALAAQPDAQPVCFRCKGEGCGPGWVCAACGNRRETAREAAQRLGLNEEDLERTGEYARMYDAPVLAEPDAQPATEEWETVGRHERVAKGEDECFFDEFIDMVPAGERLTRIENSVLVERRVKR